MEKGNILYNTCDFEFIQVIVNYENNSYNISDILNSNSHYYYNCNNKLFNQNFMNWLFIFHLKIPFSSLNYTVLILDNNAQQISIDNSKYIYLNKNDYIICNNNCK